LELQTQASTVRPIPFYVKVEILVGRLQFPVDNLQGMLFIEFDGSVSVDKPLE